ncbi:MAG TPA: SHOCT domain-containing protein [Candidatus Dormibacteraeota bacterium]
MMFRRPMVVRHGPGLLGERPPAPVATPPPTVSSEERITQLQELGELKASGVLTDEEFQREKRRVLGAV